MNSSSIGNPPSSAGKRASAASYDAETALKRDKSEDGVGAQEEDPDVLTVTDLTLALPQSANPGTQLHKGLSTPPGPPPPAARSVQDGDHANLPPGRTVPPLPSFDYYGEERALSHQVPIGHVAPPWPTGIASLRPETSATDASQGHVPLSPVEHAFVAYLARLLPKEGSGFNEVFQFDRFLQGIEDWGVRGGDRVRVIEWLLAAERRPRAARIVESSIRSSGGSYLHLAGDLIAGLPREQAVHYAEYALSLPWELRGDGEKPSKRLGALCFAFCKVSDPNTRTALLQKVSERQAALRPWAVKNDDYDLMSRDYAYDADNPDMREAWEVLERSEPVIESTIPATAADIHAALDTLDAETFEQDAGAKIIDAAVRTGDQALLFTVERELLAKCQTAEDTSYMTANVLLALSRASAKHESPAASTYFGRALDFVLSMGGETFAALPGLAKLMPADEASQHQVIGRIIEALDKFPREAARVERSFYGELARRGVLADCIRPDWRRDAALQKLGEGMVLADAAEAGARLGTGGNQWAHLEMLLGPTWKERGQQLFEQYATDLGRGYGALVLAVLDAASTDGCGPVQRAGAWELAQAMDETERARFVEALIARPKVAQTVLSQLVSQESIALQRHGDSVGTYLAMLEALHVRGGVPETPRDLLVDINRRASSVPTVKMQDDIKAWHAHGRTLHFTLSNGETRAVKLPKSGNLEELHREAVMNIALGKHNFGLQSDLPRTIGFVQIRLTHEMHRALSDSAKSAETDFNIPDNGQPIFGLLYEPPQGYEIPLHKVGDEGALRNASRRYLHDVATLAKRAGLVFEAPADLFHNTDHDARAYHWNVEQVAQQTEFRYGAGRLEAFERAISHPNYGATGVRDLKQFIPLEQYRPGFQADAATVFKSKLGDAAFAWALSVAQWYQDHGRLDETASMAQTLSDGMTTYFAALKGRSAEEIAPFVQGAVPWERMANQLKWVYSGEYKEDVERGVVRPGIYDPQTRVTIQKPEDDTWHPTLGWAADGRHRDAGPHNGPLPFTELIRALSIFTAFA